MQKEKCPDSITVAAGPSKQPYPELLNIGHYWFTSDPRCALLPRNYGVLSEQHYGLNRDSVCDPGQRTNSGLKDATMDYGNHVKIIGRDECMYSRKKFRE
jgi:hypothetical protein